MVADDDNSREVVSIGADYFPWGEEEMKRAEDEKEEREAKKKAAIKEAEEKCYAEQEAAGKIPICRHRGTPDHVKIGTDRTVEFVNFSTVAAPSGVVPNGKKAWYEITFTSGGK